MMLPRPVLVLVLLSTWYQATALSSVAIEGTSPYRRSFSDESTRQTKVVQEQKKQTKISTRAELRWEQRYVELLEFREKYGHVNVPQLPTKQIPESYRELANFCRNIRQQYKYLQNPAMKRRSYLTAERIKVLETAGFVWNSHDAAWQARFQELKEFSVRFGHYNIPAKWIENPSLSRWVSFQRQKYRAKENCYFGKPLAAWKIEQLNSIGFEWDPKHVVWWNMYRELREFYKINGHCNVPAKQNQNGKLANWVCHQRRKCADYCLAVDIEGGGQAQNGYVSGLDKDRFDALCKINFL